MAVDVVLGAGPAGLAAAFALGESSLVLEREDRAGGLCRSFSLEGKVFDYGGHAFFTTDQEVLDLLEQLAPQPLFAQPRSAWIWTESRFVPYPYQANLSFLPPGVIRACLLGLFDVAGKARLEDAGAANLEEWLIKSFGQGMFEHFFGPYNEKVWAYPLRDIVPVWVGDRIVKPNVADIIDGALHQRPFRDFPNHRVRYPAKGGYYELFRPLYERMSNRVSLGERPIDIDLNARTITTSRGRKIPFGGLISTIPLPELVQLVGDVPSEVQEASTELDHNSLLLVSVVARNAVVDDKQRIYCAPPEVPFHKLVFNHLSSAELRADKLAAIQAEISFSAHKPVSSVGLEAQVVETLKLMGIVSAESEIVATRLDELPMAYPVSTARSLRAAARICGYFEDRGALCVGRFGEWKYINADGALRRGLTAAGVLTAAKSGSSRAVASE